MENIQYFSIVDSEVQDNEILLNQLMEDYGSQLVRLAYTYVKQEQLAEDIVQDVFIKCYKNMDSFRQESSYKTWLYKITVNRCKDTLRSWSYKNMKLLDILTFQKQISKEKSPEEEALVNEENQLISEMVISLPVKLREVVLFFYYEEQKIDEISEILGISPNTVKSRLLRGKQQLKRKLERVR